MAGKQDAFKPQGKELSVVHGVQPPGAELGQHFRSQGQPQMTQNAPMSVKQGGNNRFVPASPSSVGLGDGQQPMQAQPVAQPQAVATQMAGAPVPSSPQGRRQFQPAQADQSVAHQLGAASRPIAPPQAQPQPQAQAQPQMNGAQMAGVETFAVYIDGTAPDGTPLTTDPFLAQFPVGSTLSGMRYERVR